MRIGAERMSSLGFGRN